MKIGLEIHQRLETSKLFCSCPSRIEEKDADARLERHLHPVLSEMGTLDRAALQESGKKKKFEYWAYHTSDCLVETDEEPPHALGADALAIALEVSLHLKARPVDEVHCMRKMVIDGSNTSGFQRTAIVAMNGTLETSLGPIVIPQVAIEEESAGIVETKEGVSVYRLDRLGIPLIEISTEPTIQNPEHAKEAAEKIGLLLRATGKVARGLGTIRQDLNVSIEGGARVEIKGAQDLKLIPLFVQNEVQRQEQLLKLVAEIRQKVGAKPHLHTPVDLTPVFQSTQSKVIAGGLSRGEHVLGLRVEHHAGLLGREISPNRRYGSELSDYAKTMGVKGIIHSDEDMTRYSLNPHEIETLRKMMSIKTEDAFIVVVATVAVAQAALMRVNERLLMLHVPEETRRANPDGTSSYMRPLPGSARMYPETDVPPIGLNAEFLQSIRQQKGQSLEEKQAHLAKLLNPEMAAKMIKSPKLPLFEKLVAQGIDPMLAAATLENTLVALRRDGVQASEELIEKTLQGYRDGKWVKAAIPELLRWGGNDPDKNAQERVISRIRGAALVKLVQDEGLEMGPLLTRYRLRVDPKELQDVMKKYRF